MNTQDRGNWTSASTAHRDYLCPGAYQACQGLAEPEPAEETKEGRWIHAHLHWKRTGELGQPEPECNRELASICWDMEQKALRRWRDRVPNGTELELRIESEKRFWACVVTDGQEIYHSGQVDAVYRLGRYAFIPDTKTGWLEVDEPARNEQLRDLAALVFTSDLQGIDQIEVAILQPGAEPKPPSVYDRGALDAARFRMLSRVLSSHKPDAKRIVHEDACRFCRAKGTSHCPESVGPVMSVAVQTALAGKEIMEIPSPELLQACLLAEPVIRAVKERAKLALKFKPDAIPGFGLVPNPPNKPITNVEECWKRCAAHGMELGEFMKALKITKGDLESGLKEVVRSKSAARLMGWSSTWTKLLDGITTEEPKEPSIKRV